MTKTTGVVKKQLLQAKGEIARDEFKIAPGKRIIKECRPLARLRAYFLFYSLRVLHSHWFLRRADAPQMSRHGKVLRPTIWIRSHDEVLHPTSWIAFRCKKICPRTRDKMRTFRSFSKNAMSPAKIALHVNTMNAMSDFNPFPRGKPSD